MRILSIVAIAALSAGVILSGSASASAQSDAPAPHKKVFGYQDAETGAFHPMTQVEPDVTAAPLTGEFEVTITITLKTAVPAGGSVVCSTDISATSANEITDAGQTYEEGAYAVAKVSGSTATCTVDTPYSWLVSAASSTVLDELDGSYTVSILPAATTTNVVELNGRTSTSTFVSAMKFPTTGAITKYAIKATL
jgi:hypothetical protein